MLDRVVGESRHKFVYYDSKSKGNLELKLSEYLAKLDSDEPILVYVRDDGLPKISTERELDKDIIKIFHSRYYELLIFLSIVDVIVNQVDNSLLNDRLGRLFKLMSHCTKRDINDISVLRRLLIDSKNMYRESFIEYMDTGNYDFCNNIPIPFIMMDNLVETVKKGIGLKKYFSVMIDLSGDISSYSSMAINSYIASRCNGYLSINVLLDDENRWKSYYATNGQFIQDVHDYVDVDFRSIKKRERIRHN